MPMQRTKPPSDEAPSTSLPRTEVTASKRQGGRRPFGPKPSAPSDKADVPRPPGQHLSKASSEVKNDPLWIEAFAPYSAEEMVPIAEKVNHFVGFEGLTNLTAESYLQICAHNKNFRESVAESVYAYYIATLTWNRALHLQIVSDYSE